MAKETDLKIVIDAKNNTTAGFAALKRQLDVTKVSVEGVSEAMKKVGTIGAVGFTALSAASLKLVKDSAASLQIQESFERMTKDMGLSADTLMTKLKEASAGTVSSTDLMLSANRAMALGVGNDMETVTKLMEIARLKGRALGEDTTQAFNDIVTGIGRGSPLILDNLGITLKLGEANDAYAAKLGKTAAELTEAEQKQAILNAVLESGTAELTRAGTVQRTAAEQMQALRAQFADLADTLGRTLVPAVQQLLTAVTPMITKLADWIEQNPQLTQTILLAALALTGLMAVMLPLGIALQGLVLGFQMLTAAFAVVSSVSLPLVAAIGAVIAILGVLAANGYTTATAWQEVWLGIKVTAAEGANAVIDSVEGMINFVLDGVNKAIDAINRVIKLAQKVPGLGDKLSTIKRIQAVDFGSIDVGALTPVSLSAPNPSTKQPVSVVVSGNNFLDSFGAEKIGDLIISQLKKSNAI